jgi:pimeloyl-ACP methyl ester carboxylesterase
VALVVGLTVMLTACTGGSPPAGATPPARTPTAGGPATTDPADPAGDPDLAAYYSQQLAWRDCESASGAPGFQCARLTVPVDYADPTGATTYLQLTRLPASGPGDRVGSLVVNPGGPGASGVEYAGYASAVLSQTVTARYDVVGFDPRGVGASDPVTCLTDKQTDAFLAADASPDTQAERDRLIALSRALARRCAERDPQLVAHMGTVDVARDLDVLRAALGDDRLHYLGKSYGTFLGAVYAEFFPGRVGRFVLDGALDPRSTTEQVNLGQAAGFELALGAFLDDCLGTTTCPVSGDPRTARDQLDGFLADVDAQPLPTGTPRRLTQALAVLGIVFALYDETYWPQLRAALASGLTGDGSALLMLADAYAERLPSGRYRTNANDAIYAVNCLDRPSPQGPAEIDAALPRFDRASSLFGAYIAWSSLPCHYWPFPPQRRPHPVHAAGADPILVVGTVRDPATPYRWARALADELDSGVLLSYDGDGHTAYRRGSQCIDDAVDRFLVDGQPPEDGTTCP